MTSKRRERDQQFVARVIKLMDGQLLFIPPADLLIRMQDWPVCEVRRYVERHYPHSAKLILKKASFEVKV